MSDCPNREELCHFLYGPDDALSQRVADHINSCSACNDELNAMPNWPPAAMEAVAPPASSLPVPNVRGFTIMHELGRGGMGVVYLALQLSLGRQVALKMILSGGHAGETELARFKREAEDIAHLQHPNIVQIHEVGEHEGLPFFSLEYCAGGSLERKLAGIPLPPREAADLVETLAGAMQAAHAAKVIHRDLKPANVLLTSRNAESLERSAASALPSEDSASRLNKLEPKITDFGIAKRLDEVGKTQTGTVMGTPSYMAPEQAAGNKDIGPAADIYALGAILYECLTGRPPFRAATAYETIRQVLADEPVPPRQLQSKVPRDLETVCLKCLRKEPSRRYASASAMAEDLRRFLAGEPIHARQVGPLTRSWMWAKRHPAVAGLLAAIACALVVSLVLGIFALEKAREVEVSELRAKEHGKAKDFFDYLHHIAKAFRFWENNDIAEAKKALASCREDLRGWEWDYLDGLCSPPKESQYPPLPSCLNAIGFSATDPTKLAVALQGGQVGVLDINKKTHALSSLTPGRKAFSLSSMPQQVVPRDWAGRWLTFETADRTRKPSHLFAGVIRVLDAGKPEMPRDLDADWPDRFGIDLVFDRQTEPLTGSVQPLAVSSDGRLVAYVGSSGTVHVREIATGKILATLASTVQSGTIFSIAFGYQNEQIALVGGDFQKPEKPGFLELWSWTRQQVATPEGQARHQAAVLAVACSPTEPCFASGDADGVVRLWDITKDYRPQPRTSFRQHLDPINGLAFHPKGLYLASVSGVRNNRGRGDVRIWAIQSGQDRHFKQLKRYTAGVTCATWQPDGFRLATGAADGTVMLWDTTFGQQRLPPNDSPDLTTESRYGALLAQIDSDGKGVVQDSDLKQTVPIDHLTRLTAVAFSPDGRRLASISDDSTVKLWDSGTCLEVFSYYHGTPGKNLGVRWSADGRQLIIDIDHDPTKGIALEAPNFRLAR